MNTVASPDIHPAGGRRSLMVGVTLTLYLLAAAAGFALGFWFVRNAQGGLGMGLAAGINGALFCTLLMDWVLVRLLRRRRS